MSVFNQTAKQTLSFMKALIGSALRQGEVKTLQHSEYTMIVSRQSLHCLFVRCTILHYAEPFHATLHRLYVRCAIRNYAKPFHATLNRMCVHGTIRHYAEPFDATLHRLCTVLKMSAKLFAIELVHFTISCSNST